MKKLIKRILLRVLVLGLMALLYWPLAVLYIVTGFYDVIRQKNKDKGLLFKQYFLINGTLTWILSPLNTLIDIVCLPFINKQIYKLDQLPKTHQREIRDILTNCPKQQLIDAIQAKNTETERTMLLYRWYGFNIEQSDPCPLFHKPFKRVLTIGVSTFKAQSKTKPHFGWLRAGVRVLINIDEDVGEGAYIDVNNQRHVWKDDGPLFIFDDTVLHQSFNLTDKNRHCLFIDITRPSLVPALINGVVKALGFLSTKVPYFSKASNWKLL